MFTPIFLPLTHHLGGTMYVNMDHIVSMSKQPNQPYTYLHCVDDAPEEFRMVKDTPEDIILMIQEATDFPNN
jgi:hypothetical protein